LRSKFINNYARDLVKKHGSHFSTDFEKNREIVKKLDPNLSKTEVNELAGYIAKLLKKQEELE